MKTTWHKLAALASTLLFTLSVTGTAWALVEPHIGFEIDGDPYINQPPPEWWGFEEWATAPEPKDWPKGQMWPPFPDNIEAGGPPLLDWENVLYPDPSYQLPGAVFMADPHSKNPGAIGVAEDPNHFGRGGKFADTRTWDIIGGSVGAPQSELTNVGAWAIMPGDLENVPPPVSGAPHDAHLVLAMERTEYTGTFALDFEINQAGWDGFSTLVRTEGDISVGFELQGRATDPQADLTVLIVVYEDDAYKCDVVYDKGKVVSVAAGLGECPVYVSHDTEGTWYYRFLNNAAALHTYGYATMNPSAFLVVDEFVTDYRSYTGNGGVDGIIKQFEMAEAAINLAALDLIPECPGFGTVHAKSRSSLEPGSDLKDLSGPEPLGVQCSISGHKFLDVNNNGVWDWTDANDNGIWDEGEGEPPLANWDIEILGERVVEGSPWDDATETDENGYYMFDGLYNDSYQVNEVCPDLITWAQRMPGATDFANCGTAKYGDDSPMADIAINLDNRIVEDVDFGNGQPSVDIVKTCDDMVNIGDPIPVSIVVTNDGNVDIIVQSVLDSHASLSGPTLPITLAPGASSAAFTGSHMATDPGEVTDTATVNADYADATVDATYSCTTMVYEPTVSKDASTSYEREYTWTITKDVDPAAHTAWAGETVNSGYLVSVDQTIAERDFKVFGTITVVNPNPEDAMSVDLEDYVNSTLATLDCGTSLTVPADSSASCGYSAMLGTKTDGDNRAKATLNDDYDYYSEFVPYAFGEPSSVIGFADINVDDDNGMSWAASGDASWTYPKPFTCSSDPADYAGDGHYSFDHVNVAEIRQDTSIWDDAKVDVDCYAPVVSKTASTTYTREYEWTIDKSVTPESWELFTGESGESQYTVFVDKEFVEERLFLVSGTITVQNPRPDLAMTVALSDSANGTVATLDCGSSLTILAAGSNTCGYSAMLSSKTDGLNTATATLNSIGFTGSVIYVFGEPTDVILDEITVEDEYTAPGEDPVTVALGSASDDKTFDLYYRVFECDADDGLHNNTASIVETGQSSPASVAVDCYDLAVTKDATTSYIREYNWDVDKVVDEPGPHTLLEGGSVDVNYTITVELDGEPIDSGWAVDGSIYISNNHPTRVAVLTDVVDEISTSLGATVVCSSMTVPAGGQLTCTYSRDLDNADSRNNEATATQQLYDFNYLEQATVDGTKDYSGTAGVIFGAPYDLIDECADVTDTNGEFFAMYGIPQVCLEDEPATFIYPRTIDVPVDAECGINHVFDNTARVDEIDTSDYATDPADVTIYVPCGEGCTPGFWNGGNGMLLWDSPSDMDWVLRGGNGYNPYDHDTLFNVYFAPHDPATGWTMFDLVSTGGGDDAWQKAARNVVAAYLNASFGMDFPYSTAQVSSMWAAAALADPAEQYDAFMNVHLLLGAANSPDPYICGAE